MGKKATVTTKGYMGRDWTITGDLKAGLMVHKMGQTWAITHVATGMGIGTSKRRRLKADAIATRDKLLKIAPNWNAHDVQGLALANGMTARDFSDAVRAIAY